MPNLASVLKDEIRRLARREARAEIGSLKSASAQYRRDIAALKRRVNEQERTIARLQKRPATGKAAAASIENGTSVRFSPGWVANHREKLGLSAADYAALVGVSPITIYSWEKGRSRPKQKQLQAWGAVKKLGKREAWKKLDEMEA